MHGAKRLKTLTNYLSARLTPAEDKRIKERADKAGLTKSEWCRLIILNALEIDLGTRILLGEVLAVRKIVLALQIDLLQDREPTEERIRTVIEQADLSKASLVDQRVQAFLSQAEETNR